MSAVSERFHRHFRLRPDAEPDHIEAKWPDPDLGEDILTGPDYYFGDDYLKREDETFVLALLCC